MHAKYSHHIDTPYRKHFHGNPSIQMEPIFLIEVLRLKDKSHPIDPYPGLVCIRWIHRYSRLNDLQQKNVKYVNGWEYKVKSKRYKVMMQMRLLIFITFKLLGWWLDIHFLFSLDAIFIKGKIIIWSFLCIQIWFFILFTYTSTKVLSRYWSAGYG